MADRVDTGAREPQPQEEKLDRATVERWRREAVTAPAQDRLWLNRCEALCNALAAGVGVPPPENQDSVSALGQRAAEMRERADRLLANQSWRPSRAHYAEAVNEAVAALVQAADADAVEQS